MNKILKLITIASALITSAMSIAQSSSTYSYPNVGGGSVSITLNTPNYVGVDIINTYVHPIGIVGDFYFEDGDIPWIFNFNKGSLAANFGGKSNIMVTGTWSSPRPNVVPPSYLTVTWTRGTETVVLGPGCSLTTSWGNYTNNTSNYKGFTNPFTPSIQIFLTSQTRGSGGVSATYSTQSPGWDYNSFMGYYTGGYTVNFADACLGDPVVNVGIIEP